MGCCCLQTGLRAREIIKGFRVAAAPFITASGVDGVDAETVMDVVGLFLHRRDILAADVARLTLIGYLIQINDAVRRTLVTQDLPVLLLFQPTCRVRACFVQTEVLRRADIDDLLGDHSSGILCQIFLGDIAAVQRGEIGRIIPDAVAFDGFVGRIGDLHAACDCPGLGEFFGVIRHLRRNGADKARLIARRLLLHRLLLGRLFWRCTGDHADEQDQRDQNQDRDHHAPGMLAQKNASLRQPLCTQLPLRRGGHSLCSA